MFLVGAEWGVLGEWAPENSAAVLSQEGTPLCLALLHFYCKSIQIDKLTEKSLRKPDVLYTWENLVLDISSRLHLNGLNFKCYYFG